MLVQSHACLCELKRCVFSRFLQKEIHAVYCIKSSAHPHPTLSVVTVDQETQLMRRIFKACGFSLSELLTLRAVWPQAAEQHLADIRKLQYQLNIGWSWSQSDHTLAWDNRHHFAGHSRFLVQLAKSIDSNNDEQVSEVLRVLGMEKTVTCDDLGCSKSMCRPSLTANDAVELLSFQTKQGKPIKSPQVSKYTVCLFCFRTFHGNYLFVRCCSSSARLPFRCLNKSMMKYSSVFCTN